MAVLKRDDAEIHYEEYGAGYPILLFAPGGMRSAAAMWLAPPGGPPRVWNNWIELLSQDYRVITMDQHNAGNSVGAIEADHGWDTYAADQLALMDHLGIDRFNTLGGCIGSSFCLKMAEVAPARVNAMVLQNPIGVNPTIRPISPTASSSGRRSSAPTGRSLIQRRWKALASICGAAISCFASTAISCVIVKFRQSSCPATTRPTRPWSGWRLPNCCPTRKYCVTGKARIIWTNSASG
jgi:pimeloyl-ACP methyl ester carboxylesterase